MLRPVFFRCGTVFIPLALLFITAIHATDVSIEQTSEYKEMRNCAKWCLSNPTGDDVRSAMGCGTVNGYGQNECYCDLGIHFPALAWLPVCAINRCGDIGDKVNVVGLYISYCETAVRTATITPAVHRRSPKTAAPEYATAVEAATPELTGLPLPSAAATVDAALLLWASCMATAIFGAILSL